jgi:hypothetical protein
MAWIESHQSLREHPKLIELSQRLSEKKVTLIGHLHCLWWWCIDYAQDGDLSQFSEHQIAMAAGWEKDPKELVRALTEVGFMENGTRIHDWLDFCGDLVKKRIEYKNSKKKRSKKISRFLGDSQRKPENSQRTVPYPTVPNQTNQSKSHSGVPPDKPIHVQFVDKFKATYEAVTGNPFKYGVAQFVLAKSLIDKYGLEVVIEKTKLLGDMCQVQKTWFTKGGWADFTIEKLSGQWNSIIANGVPDPEVAKKMEILKELRRMEDARLDIVA